MGIFGIASLAYLFEITDNVGKQVNLLSCFSTSVSELYSGYKNDTKFLLNFDDG